MAVFIHHLLEIEVCPTEVYVEAKSTPLRILKKIEYHPNFLKKIKTLKNGIKNTFIKILGGKELGARKGGQRHSWSSTLPTQILSITLIISQYLVCPTELMALIPPTTILSVRTTTNITTYHLTTISTSYKISSSVPISPL